MASTTYPYRRLATGVAVVVLLLGACGSGEQPTDPADGVTGPAPTAESPTPESTGTPAPEPEDPGTDRPPEVAAAITDLAEHLGIAVEDITVVSYEDVTWPDGALGCPEPGMSYTQALVPGTRLVLEAGGVEYSYHAGREPDLVRCDRAPQEPADT